MPVDQYLARLSCRVEPSASPLSATAVPYVEALFARSYAKRTRYRPNDDLLKLLESL